jgi:hypothetical protein
MSEVLSDQYWTEEFQVTQADLDRIESYIRRTGQAHDLTTLARRVVQGRLQHGPETSAPVQTDRGESPSVRLWDPAGKWKVGDHVIILAWSYRNRRQEVFVGEIVHIDTKHEHIAHIAIDDVRSPRPFQLAPAGSPDAIKWHQTVRDAVEAMQRDHGLEEQANLVILRHGQRIISQLLDALRADRRFVRLAGYWFLRDLAAPLTDEQLTALAWAMVPLEEPQPTDALVPLVHPPLSDGDRGLFGLYLAMRERPHLFRNVDPRQRPRWVLAGPPPGSCVPRHAAYDPETYEVLCLPGQPIPPETVQRLWDLGLLRAVL